MAVPCNTGKRRSRQDRQGKQSAWGQSFTVSRTCDAMHNTQHSSRSMQYCIGTRNHAVMVYILDWCHHRAEVCFVLILRWCSVVATAIDQICCDSIMCYMATTISYWCLSSVFMLVSSLINIKIVLASDDVRVDYDASESSCILSSQLLAMPYVQRSNWPTWKHKNVRVYVQAPHIVFMQAVSYLIVHVNERVCIKPLQQLLIHDKHTSALYARPHCSWSDASEPTRQTFRPVDDS